MTNDNTPQDFYGQYASDRVLLGADSDLLNKTGADTRGDGTIGFHMEGLFDELSPLPDPATGHIAKVEGELDVEGISIVSDDVAINGLKKGGKGRAEDEPDAADKWMKDHGYNW